MQKSCKIEVSSKKSHFWRNFEKHTGHTAIEMNFYDIKDNLDFDQLIWEFGAEPKWLHVSYVSEKENRGQVLVIKRPGVYHEWSPCKNC